MSFKINIEVCAQSLYSAIVAQEGGADRIELCAALELGGITPSYALLDETRRRLDIDICVLVRPRGGDFIHSDIEFDLIKKDIVMCKKMGMNGIVVGIQKPDGFLDIEKMTVLHDLARPMTVVCHRVFDRLTNPFEAMEDLIGIGYDRILTSGQAETAPKGIAQLRGLVQQANGRIAIMPGGGVLADNVVGILNQTGAKDIHFTAKYFLKEKNHWETDIEQVRLMVDNIRRTFL